MGLLASISERGGVAPRGVLRDGVLSLLPGSDDAVGGANCIQPVRRVIQIR